MRYKQKKADWKLNKVKSKTASLREKPFKYVRSLEQKKNFIDKVIRRIHLKMDKYVEQCNILNHVKHFLANLFSACT